MREAVCDPHCPLTEKGRVKRTLGAEPLSPGALASRATLTKGRRRGGGGGGDRGLCSLAAVPEPSGGWGHAGRAPPAAAREEPPGLPRGGRCSRVPPPLPGPLLPHPARPSAFAPPPLERLSPPLSPARLALGPALLQPDTAPPPQCHLFQVQPPPRFQEGREFGEDALYPARLEVT